ncbi:hypothetical protein V5799_005850 [Amblyomma americanum]|uniref:HAT C-terminal dimerisation domain-containing protein n=1 Tax=Amblyomma americanum TaxID=6943 RepID=A0AAQ4DY28_AMBAM
MAVQEAEKAGTSQPMLFDVSCRQRAKENEADGVIHDFVRALAYSGISMHQADGPLGDFVRKYCKAAKTMPTGQRLRIKYLKEAFDKDMAKIRNDMQAVKVSVIVDESSDITGVPTINTLLCYYSQKAKKKQVCLVDVDRVNASNSYTVARVVGKALLTVGKTWKDVVAVATDSAEYMRKMVREICEAEAINILHVKDLAHLIHVSVDHAISSPCVSDVRSAVIKFGALFKHANKLHQKYIEICASNSLFGADAKKPPSVVPNRWQSFYKALVVVTEMWSSLTELVECSHDSTKAEAIRAILSEKEVLYAKAVLMRDALEPLLDVQKTLESGELLMPSFDHLVNVKLQQTVNELSTMIGKSDRAKGVLSMLPKSSVILVKTCCEEFCAKISTKWDCTLKRNVSDKQENQLTLWKLGAVLDPFQKQLLSQSFDDYRPLFNSVMDDVGSLREEFNQYLLEASPTNEGVEVMDFWNDATVRYPRLANAALSLLCLANGSCDVERTFSQLRYLQRPDRSRMETEMLRMQMNKYVNKDV